MRLFGTRESERSAASRLRILSWGRRGEALAIQHLERAGYRIVAANFRVPIGRNVRDVLVNAEIDVVAYDGPTLCFIEVKTRASDEFTPPQANVDLRKRRQIARAARGYRRMLGLMSARYRYGRRYRATACGKLKAVARRAT